MNLPNPKLNLKTPHIKTNFGVVLSIAVIVVLLFELYLVYIYFYKKLLTGPVVLDQEHIVRVDLTTYKSVIEELNQRESFTPNNPRPTNPEPFK